MRWLFVLKDGIVILFVDYFVVIELIYRLYGEFIFCCIFRFRFRFRYTRRQTQVQRWLCRRKTYDLIQPLFYR